MHRTLSTLFLVAVFTSTAIGQLKPNIILINIDDLGYADIGPYGSNNKTPNLDRMASEGRKLMSHYAAPVCSPSRASLMTGSYAKRALPIDHVLFPAASVGLNPNEVTIAELLKGAGYATACIGKWHLGDQPDFLPTKQGFDSYFGIPYSNDMGPPSDGSKSNPDKPLPASTNRTQDETGIKGAGQPPLPLVENDKVVGRVRVEEQFDITRRYTERAVQYIRDHRKEPFFLYLPHNAVHFPLYPSKNFRGKSPNGLVGDWAEEIDWSVGEIFSTLRELQLDQKTLVVFTSDNGGPVNQGANNKPLKGAKGSTWEGGIRTCTLAWWPGKIPANTSTDAITSMMDMLPTFAKLGGAALPTDRKIDGVDLWPVLAGDPAGKPPRDHFFYYKGLTLEAVRLGPWKMHLEVEEGTQGNKKRRPIQLYNLIDDIGETKNLAAEHPDVLEKLKTFTLTMQDDLGLEGIGPGCRQLGRVTDPLPFIGYDGLVRPSAIGKQISFP